MPNDILQLYVSEQLTNFNRDKRCCMKFMGQLFTLDPRYFVKICQAFGMRMRPCMDKGQESMIVFKEECCHVPAEVLELKLCPESLKDLFMFNCGSDFGGSVQEFQMSPNVASPSTNVPPVVPPHRFSLGPLKQSIARCNGVGHQSFQKQCPMQPYKELILKALERSRVLVINGSSTLGKSTSIPMYIIEKCGEEKRHCKIICVEREQLVAIHNSEVLAGHLHEKVGETVAYQVQLQSRISDSSNLVYTTSSFLLRVLMGQSIMDSFRHISHVVVVDAHLHEAYADLLLRELKVALMYHPYLKIVLLSNFSKNYEFLEYFGEGEEIKLEGYHYEGPKSDIFYLEDIIKILPDSRPSKQIARAFNTLPITNPNLVTAAAPSSPYVGKNSKCLDKILEAYERTASDQNFDTFMYMVQGEDADINHRNSITGRTILNIASMLGKAEHVKLLLEFGANPYIIDKFDVDALKMAYSKGHLECVEILKEECFEKPHCQAKDIQSHYRVDYALIVDIIYMLTTKNDLWRRGNIIVYLPSYQHLIQLNYYILKQKLLGNVPDQISIFMLHSHTEKSHLDIILQPNNSIIKIILTTNIAENLRCFDNLLYVIDTALNYRCVFNNLAQNKENVYEWVAKQSMESRHSLLASSTGIIGGGCCFRLLPVDIYNKLHEVQTPDLLTVPLDRICLSAKLLAQHSMVSEYLQETIIKPPFMHIYRAVENLKKISVFTELEDITWLGCRLIDVPVECQLGKLLVFSVLLQCLDPVLTIVSFMTTLDPFETSHFMDDLIEPYKEFIRSKIKEERIKFSEGLYSDHLVFLRLYQDWQNDLREDNTDNVPNKYNFMLNGLLEHVCNVRTTLVGALRSSQLIHNKGNLSMHYINQKSHCWPIIKAALAGGLYPSICALDRQCNRLKSPGKSEIVVHPNSVLRDLNVESMKNMNFPSPWIMYGKSSRSWNCNSISCNTIVAGISVALFAGPTKISTSNIQIISMPSASESSSQCYFNIDEWITLKMDYSEALLLLKTRQHFYNIYTNYLQRCGVTEKFKRPTMAFSQNTLLFDCIEKILIQEDTANGFRQPERIGLRPKAIPTKLMMTLNSGMFMTPCLYRTPQLNVNANSASGPINPTIFQVRNKQYFMVYRKENEINDTYNHPNTYRNSEWFHVLTTLLNAKTEATKLTFIIFYTRHPDLLRSVSIAEWSNGYLELNHCFKYNINLHNILNNGNANNAALTLALSQKRTVFALDQNIGQFILNMFAYRNNWLHNNHE
ncbi:benign gonial cell neoplasm [Haematobia irritans]|uniref:benign gonial cell neoplasm n=1 Tax=Haematobia irritans TaxID=7368 RepID=UPI003F4F41F9